MPSTWVCGDCTSPVGEEPMESSLPSIISVPAEEVINLYEVLGLAMMVTHLFDTHRECIHQHTGMYTEDCGLDHLVQILQDLSDLDD